MKTLFKTKYVALNYVIDTIVALLIVVLPAAWYSAAMVDLITFKKTEIVVEEINNTPRNYYKSVYLGDSVPSPDKLDEKYKFVFRTFIMGSFNKEAYFKNHPDDHVDLFVRQRSFQVYVFSNLKPDSRWFSCR